MQVTCVAIDDEPLSLKLFLEYALLIPQLSVLKCFDDAVEGLKFLQQNRVDILFLDIDMPDISGLEIVKALSYKPVIIFITAYKKFAFEGFELEAVDYLLKPVSKERFIKAANKAIDLVHQKNELSDKNDDAIFVWSEYKAIKILLNEIEFIESLGDYIKIHTTNNSSLLTLMTMKSIQEKLPERKFIRVHRSYIISVSKIKSVLSKKIILTSLKEVPLGDTYSSSLKNILKRL